jgi:exodeoxyribonuclease VIII
MADDSMAKYKAYRDGKIRYKSVALDLGSAVHAMIESADTFSELYTVKPSGIDYRTKEGKSWKEANSSLIILDAEAMETVEGCYEAWRTSTDPLIRIARESHGEAEISRFWEEDDVLCKVRADRLVTVSGSDNEYLAETWPSLFNPISNTIVVDFKTTSRSASPRGFGYAAKDFKYLLKSAHYLAGFKADAFMFVVMETSPPFHITRYLVSPSTRDFYMARRQELLEQLVCCEESGYWPGLTVSDEETLL